MFFVAQLGRTLVRKIESLFHNSFIKREKLNCEEHLLVKRTFILENMQLNLSFTEQIQHNQFVLIIFQLTRKN